MSTVTGTSVTNASMQIVQVTLNMGEGEISSSWFICTLGVLCCEGVEREREGREGEREGGRETLIVYLVFLAFV